MTPRGTHDDPVYVRDARRGWEPTTRTGKAVQTVAAFAALVAAVSLIAALSILAVGTVIGIVLHLVGVI